MAEHETDRPGSRGYHPSPAPPSPRPSVASRASKSSLRQEQVRQDAPAHPRPASVAYSRPHTPQAVAAPVDEHRPQPSPSPPQPTQPPFAPLFTLINSTLHSSNRQTTHHPTVHYIFADDDPEILTAALAHHHRGGYEDNPEEGDPSKPLDRALLLDVEPTPDGSGLEVSWAGSLTPDWAVTSASLNHMEGGGGGGATSTHSGNLVLKIEGVSIEPPSGGPLGKRASPDAELHSSGGSAGRHSPPPAVEEYAGLLQDFEKRMSTLRKVVEAGQARQRALEDEPTQVPEETAMEGTSGAYRSGVASDDA